MKASKYIFTFLILSLTSIGFSQKKINQRDETNFKTGHWIYFGKDRPEMNYCSDCKVEEGDYINDRKEGVWIKYHSNGNQKLKGEFVNGRPKGPYEKYWQNGNLKEKGCFDQTKNNNYCENDTTYRYDSLGVLIEKFTANYTSLETKVIEKTLCTWKSEIEVVYESDSTKSNITQVSNYQPKEIIYQSSMNMKGVPFNPDGYNKVYTEVNELYLEGIFKNGLFWDGKHYVYDQDGILLKVEVYKDGKYFSEGQL